MTGRDLSNPTFAKRWTRQEYRALAEAGILSADARLELIEGKIFEVTPQGSKHATTVMRVFEALREHNRSGCIVRCQLPLSLGVYSEPEPDLAIVEGEISTYEDAHPTSALLVVEVADTTLKFDRTTKAELYAKAGIPTYWIVNLLDRQIEIYTDPGSLAENTSGFGYRSRKVIGEQGILKLEGSELEIPVLSLLPR